MQQKNFYADKNIQAFVYAEKLFREKLSTKNVVIKPVKKAKTYNPYLCRANRIYARTFSCYNCNERGG